MTPAEIEDLLPYLTEDERKELDAILAAAPPWVPLPGPQTEAYTSQADIIGYGGAAGGGKTDLACGKALTQHRRCMILRREGTQLTGIIDRLTEIVGNKDGYNGQDRIWRLPDVQIEFGSTPNLGDENKYQGRPHDLLVFDEAANFLEAQVRFLLGWLRTTTPGQKCQALLTFNPPTSAEGRWIIDFFGPWLDDKHPNPAEPGELRWYATVDGADVECASGEPFTHNGELITPLSRTFIPSRVSDNPFLVGTGYMAQLQSLPEPLRSQMLYGDFKAGIQDDPYQVIPTSWVDAAVERWEDRSAQGKGEMSNLGIDVARGGQDETVIIARHGNWYDMPKAYAGADTPDGSSVAALAIAAARNRCTMHIDVIGVGASPYDFLREARQPVYGVNVSESATAKDKSGMLSFTNLRSQLWWQMREALDPLNPEPIALPPHKGLRADLCAPTWRISGRTIQVESREDIVKRIGRSPDYGSACILARMDTPRAEDVQRSGHNERREYNPLKRTR